MAKKVNPWAVCHASTGPKTGSKFERCVMKVKKKQGIDEMNTLDLMTDKIVESIELLEYQNMYEEVLEEAIEFLLAQDDLTIESVREGIEHEDIRVDEIAPLLMLGARLAAPYVMRAIGSRVAGNLAGRAAGWAGQKIMQKGGQRVATRLFGKHAGKVTDVAGKAAKGEIKDLAGNIIPQVKGPKFKLGDEEEKKKKPKIDQLGSQEKTDPLGESLDVLSEGFADWIQSRTIKLGRKLKDPMTYVKGAGKALSWMGKTALGTAANMFRDVPFVGGALQGAQSLVKSGSDKAKQAKQDTEDRKQAIIKRQRDPKRKAALRQAEKDREEAKKAQGQSSDPIYGTGTKINTSTELFGQKIVEGVKKKLTKKQRELDRNKNGYLDTEDFQIMRDGIAESSLVELKKETYQSYAKKAAAQVDSGKTPEKKELKRIKGIGKAETKVAKASMGPNNPKNTFKPKPKLNKKYIERGKKGKPEIPMTKAQIDRSGTGGKPAAGRPGQTKSDVLKKKLAKIDATSKSFMANLAKNPKNSQK